MFVRKPYLDEITSIIQSFTSTSKSAIFLEAGHFDPRQGATEFSKITLQDSLKLAKVLIKHFNKQVKIVLGILIDDLRLECGETGCSLTPQAATTLMGLEGSLPKELEDILICPYVKRERVIISSERACKNRSVQALKKLIKSENYQNILLLRESENSSTKVLFEDDELNEILLAEFALPIWKARCPAIMGQHYIDCFSKMLQRFTDSTNLVVVDWSEMLDYAKVTAGSNAALKVFHSKNLISTNLNIINVFFADDAGSVYEIRTFQKGPSCCGFV